MPVIYLVAKRSQLSLITVGIPALAGLSAMHGLVPPHPGPLTAIDLLGADLGITLKTCLFGFRTSAAYPEHWGTETTGVTLSRNGCIGTRGAPGDVGSDSWKLNSPLCPGAMPTCTSKLG